jgi:hypothetical protein
MSTEQQLAELFDEQARQAPAPDALLDGAMRQVRTRRRRIAAAVGGTAVIGAALLLMAGMSLGSGAGTPMAGPSGLGTVPAGKAGSPLGGDSGAESCAYGYSPERIATTLDFAFDGTVVSIGDSLPQLPNVAQKAGYAGVTLRVNEWFMGDTREDTITLNAPAPGTNSIDSFGSPSEYAPGTRLLVSGVIADAGAPVAYAWFGCGGFTRYYGNAVADSWRSATR